MSYSNFKKQLKKRLRFKRLHLSLGILLLLLVVAGWGLDRLEKMTSSVKEAAYTTVQYAVSSGGSDHSSGIRNAGSMSKAAPVVREPQEVFVQKQYVCGEETSAFGMISADEIASLQKQHPDWEARQLDGHKLLFVQKIGDLSPKCKQNAYIGMDKEGNLVLFDGPPAQEQVLQTFFQMDVKYLESSLPSSTVQQLRKGIRVSDMAEYNSVLSTFSTYAIGESERVMKPQR